ncbi:hypothetical protein EVAR_73661_1 [Eumeta japonica]|uniref:Uncharacterized protein n=1 Tax=Eumeta variegata TaxID=151549 RepID=A0A4C1TDI1_EUMVA|nr:hypothetical protein EVAR_73661_1 [Eumeta japonica]
MHLAKRLNEELASQQQQTNQQTGSLEAARPISPDDSSTNELPLTEIDFSINPSTPESLDTCTAYPKSTSPGDRLQKRHAQLLTMRRMESGDEPDFVQKLRVCRKISPLATNERPLSCNCSYHLPSVSEDVAYPHSHAKSETDITDILPYAAVKNSSPPILTPSPKNSFEEEYQLSSSAPAALMSGEFHVRNQSLTLKPSSASNSPTASTLQLCQALDEPKKSLNLSINITNSKHVSSNSRDFKPIMQCLPSAQSAPVIVDLANPFKYSASYSFKQFAPIAENVSTNTNISVITTDTLTSSTNTKPNSNLSKSLLYLNNNLTPTIIPSSS